MQLVKFVNLRSATGVTVHNQLPPLTNSDKLLPPQVHLMVTILFSHQVVDGPLFMPSDLLFLVIFIILGIAVDFWNWHSVADAPGGNTLTLKRKPLEDKQEGNGRMSILSIANDSDSYYMDN